MTSSIAIGYAFSLNITNQSHLSPALFYHEPELEHLNWIATIYPKFEHPEKSLPVCNLQLSNYLAYYYTQQVVIIGGDMSVLESIHQTYSHTLAQPASIYLLHPQPQAIIQPYLNDQEAATYSSLKGFDAPSDIIQSVSQYVRTTPQDPDPDQHQILIIDAQAWDPILHQLANYAFNLIVITGYCATLDPSKKAFNQIKAFIQASTN